MEDPNQNPQVKPSGRLPSLLNPKFPISNATFHLFPNLPTELRQMIWEQSLTCERYITVELCTVDDTTGKLRRNGSYGKAWPVPKPYRLLFHYPPKPSALFSTSVESRASAQRFYRIVLPCFYVTESPSIIDSLQIRTLSFNPELDTLEIMGLPQFTNFANDVWNHDPRNIGIPHLPDYASSEDQLRQVIARLRSVTFVYYTNVDTVTHTSLAHRRCLLQNRCLLPVAWATGSFSRQQDPRLIGQEVFHSVHFDLWSIEDFDKPYQTWMELAEKLRVTTPCAFKIAYTTNRSKSPIRCESDAVAYLNSESERWEQQLNKWEASQQEQAWRDPKETKRQSNGAVETAIGFWTFPIEPHGQFSRDYNRPKGGRRCFDDLSASRPELCLFDL
ncbi:hypothetical protein FOC4_g10005566 [Fusarium odoratissimum]|uniref:2EXR domain-containing protein n=1 Tax=Fusarium oxysporum f. sp. cubense (strain race 4) TaxID=2502994 RepID=N1RZ04_FUSC4|nr:hypothetical protein FOC4_g10005566 [Fusarium odoratissimum]